jgi:hypothetical protein
MGDGPKGDLVCPAGGDSHKVADYLFDENGVQVTQSIKDQEVEDLATYKQNRLRLKKLLFNKGENLPDEEQISI